MSAGTPIDIGLTDGASVTSLPLTTIANSAAGNLIIAVCPGLTAGTQPSSVTDTPGNTYTIQADAAAVNSSYAFSSNTLAVASGGTITGNFAGAAGAHGLFCMSVSGISTAADPRDKVPAGVGGTATAATLQNSGVLAQADELLIGTITFNGTPGTFTPGGNWILLKADDTNISFRVCYQIVNSTASVSWAPSWVTSRTYKSRIYSFKGDGIFPPSVASGGIGKAKGKNKGKRVWRVMLPDGKIVICDSPTEYYNLLTRVVNEVPPADPVQTRQNEVAAAIEAAAEPERPPEAERPIIRLRPAEKREAMSWAAAEDMAVNLRALADSIRAARTPMADNDDDEAVELLRWVI